MAAATIAVKLALPVGYQNRCGPKVKKKDSLTKATADAYKVDATYLERKTWVVRFNHDFVSARKQQRLRRAKELQEQSSSTPARLSGSNTLRAFSSL